MDRCINCGIATNHCNNISRRRLNDETILSVIRQWLAHKSVNSSDYICNACWDLAQSPDVDVQRRLLGHRNVCIRCGRSLATRASHLLHTNSTRESRIYNVIQERIIPLTIETGSHVCHGCWVAADRAAVRMVSGPSTSSQQDRPQEDNPAPVSPNEVVRGKQPEPTIVLPEYMRASETESRCFIEGCRRTDRYRVPLSIRKMLLNQYKYYIPENNRLCDQHLVIEAWDFLESLRSNYIKSFTAKHIQDMLSLKEVG
ncbi:unnamed protein product [Euphydryas editha]|uniref:Uncharacterized protein n=1 Tax=Euphydryas editha TaxID=104508 RepID=A0AAU9TKR5_EUPED|nr:unnamed protein product [Euphydryas editha]